VPDDPSVVQKVVVRPSATQTVLVVASTEPERIRKQLDPELARSVCVIASRWTRGQVYDTRRILDQRMREWQLYTIGESADEDCQLIILAKAVRVVPDLAAWARDVPDALLRVCAWLRPSAA
jgi:hypothetical protein